jgi:hypothetical protein
MVAVQNRHVRDHSAPRQTSYELRMAHLSLNSFIPCQPIQSFYSFPGIVRINGSIARFINVFDQNREESHCRIFAGQNENPVDI